MSLGRSADSGLRVTVFGCTGFVGRYLVNKLGQCGTQVIVPYRGNEDDINHLKVMGDLGRILPLRFHLRNQGQLHECVKGSDVVVNLVAADRRSLNFKVEEVNVDGAVAIAGACAAAGVRRFIQVSSLSADTSSSVTYLASKGKTEYRLRREYPDTIIIRPSMTYGTEDRVINAMGMFITSPSGFPVVNHGKQSRYPLYVGDLAEGLRRLCFAENVDGKTFDLVGPEKLTYAQMLNVFCQLSLRPYHPLNLSPLLLWLYARLSPEWRRPIYTRDFIRHMMLDEIPNPAHLGFSYLGMHRLARFEEGALAIARGYRSASNFSKVVKVRSPAAAGSS